MSNSSGSLRERPRAVKVCLVGSGGREHALALGLARSADVVVTPGNPAMAGTTPEGHVITTSGLPPEQVDADLYVIGPEQPLVDGLSDRLRGSGKLVFGPGSDGAMLEGSKAFMKELLSEARVPTARYGVFEDPGEAKAFLRSLDGPWVVKTDGLAAGKGVLVTDSMAEAEADVDAKLSGESFGDAGRTIVVEEGLSGPECSLLVLCDGRRVLPLVPAQDFKRIADGDEGPNTGGMGAYSPVPVADARTVDRVMDESVEPLVAALRRRSVDYRGVLYAGLILTTDGPKILEYNVRFGDPETQVVVPRIDEDLTGLLVEAASGRLRTEPRATTDACVCVVLAAYGYPGQVRSGDLVEGVETASELTGVTVLHAGTSLDESGRLLTAGGRVLDVVAKAATIAAARRRAYEAVGAIGFEGMQYRSDIAAHAGETTPAEATAMPLAAPESPAAADAARGAARATELGARR